MFISRQKVLHLKNYLEMGLLITAAYGSSKDVSVYSSAGVNSSRIFSVTGGKRGCTSIDSYASHLKDLNEGLYDFAKPFDSSLNFPATNSLNILNPRFEKNFSTNCYYEGVAFEGIAGCFLGDCISKQYLFVFQSS